MQQVSLEFGVMTAQGSGGVKCKDRCSKRPWDKKTFTLVVISNRQVIV